MAVLRPPPGPVHPRSRGEHVADPGFRIANPGSSPLARGTPRPQPARRPAHRFIPARAGNTSSLLGMRIRSSVHPRSRGEHCPCRSTRPRSSGSSPLARGTRAPRPLRPDDVRFIPARAGNTRSAMPAPMPRAVHPRSRGEHLSAAQYALGRVGSSPLARGTRAPAAVPARDHRFIPARAGNTGAARVLRSRRPVHPRSRGEHGFTHLCYDGQYGSSPLARGTPRPAPHRRRAGRFIPARAGNTPRSASMPLSMSVHPRSRGEHAYRRGVSLVADGSSPLARGTPWPAGHELRGRRFIPARAGNTSPPACAR